MASLARKKIGLFANSSVNTAFRCSGFSSFWGTGLRWFVSTATLQNKIITLYISSLVGPLHYYGETAVLDTFFSPVAV